MHYNIVTLSSHQTSAKQRQAAKVKHRPSSRIPKRLILKISSAGICLTSCTVSTSATLISSPLATQTYLTAAKLKTSHFPARALLASLSRATKGSNSSTKSIQHICIKKGVRQHVLRKLVRSTTQHHGNERNKKTGRRLAVVCLQVRSGIAVSLQTRGWFSGQRRV